MIINTKEKEGLELLLTTLRLAWFHTYAENRKKGLNKEEANKQGYIYLNNVAYSMEEINALTHFIDKLLK